MKTNFFQKFSISLDPTHQPRFFSLPPHPAAALTLDGLLFSLTGTFEYWLSNEGSFDFDGFSEVGFWGCWKLFVHLFGRFSGKPARGIRNHFSPHAQVSFLLLKSREHHGINWKMAMKKIDRARKRVLLGVQGCKTRKWALFRVLRLFAALCLCKCWIFLYYSLDLIGTKLDAKNISNWSPLVTRVNKRMWKLLLIFNSLCWPDLLIFLQWFNICLKACLSGYKMSLNVFFNMLWLSCNYQLSGGQRIFE